MTDQEILTQLKKLKAVEPDKSWLMAARSEVLSKTPVFDCAVKTGFNISSVRAGNDCRDKKSFVPETDNLYRDTKFCVPTENNNINKKQKFSFPTLFNFKQFKPAMAGLMIGAMILGGGSILTVKASQNSLPGDSLYGVKRMMEGTQITIASDKNKPALETKFVGYRLEEMVKISESVSDVEQEGKIKKLAREVEEGMKKTENHLAALSESPKEAAKAAKTVNVQTEKYAAVLVEASDKMPEPVKKEVEETMGKAADSTEKVNFKALGILADAADKDNLGEAEISKEEVKVLIQDILDKKVEINEEPPLTPPSQGGEEENEEMESGIWNLESGDGNSVVEEIKTEMDKIEIDCAECGEEICLEEIDEEGNVRCYIEQAIPTVEDKLDEGDLAGAMKILEEEDGDVKGIEDEEVLDDDGEEDEENLEIGN